MVRNYQLPFLWGYMGIILILAVFLIPIASIIPVKGTIVWWQQVVALMIVGSCCFAYQFWKLNKFLSLFIFYTALSYIFVTDCSPRSMLCLLIGYLGCAVMLFASQLKNRKPVYTAIIIMAVLDIIYSILQVNGIDPFFQSLNGSRREIIGFVGSNNQLGVYHATTAFFTPILIPLSVIPIFLAKQNSSLIGLVAGTLSYFILSYRIKALVVTVVMILCLSIFWGNHCGKSKTEIMERVNLWKLSIEQTISGRSVITSEPMVGRTIVTNPWLGYGIGNFFVFSNKTQGHIVQKDTHVYEHAHNDFVEAFYEFGYIGLFLLLGIVFSIFSIFFHLKNKSRVTIILFSSLIAQAVSSCGVYIFHAPVSLFMVCLILGLFYAECKDGKA